MPEIPPGIPGSPAGLRLQEQLQTTQYCLVLFVAKFGNQVLTREDISKTKNGTLDYIVRPDGNIEVKVTEDE
jgi:hypothetical protein